MDKKHSTYFGGPGKVSVAQVRRLTAAFTGVSSGHWGKAFGKKYHKTHPDCVLGRGFVRDMRLMMEKSMDKKTDNGTEAGLYMLRFIGHMGF